MMLIPVDAGTKVHTVGVGVAIGQACMLLAAGHKGKRFMLPHATGARQQLRCLPACRRSGDVSCDIKSKANLQQAISAARQHIIPTK